MKKSIWNEQASSTEWNLADNWTPATVPTESAVFADSSQTVITFSPSLQATVENIEFSAGACAYTLRFGTSSAAALTISGEGLKNFSGIQQSFIVAATSSGYKTPQLKFTGSASAGGDDLYYCAGPESEQGYGGGVICFCDHANAGSASFKVWTGAGRPPPHNTVGGEVSFCDNTSAQDARFTIYGSLGSDGDTFGNVVFHDSATAARASFTNVGGTVSGGDGGNTQFYGSSTAARGVFYNYGGTHSKANGGDVAFDTQANGGSGSYYNYAAPAEGAYGGVTSFNNNPPHTPEHGASAGQGHYVTFGAREGELGGGGHLEFSARYGSPTAANATIVNYGSTIEGKSSAGHTVFSINLPSDYFPSAGNASIWNHPAAKAGAAAGFTQFSIYGEGQAINGVPTAGEATLMNLGGYSENADGGYTIFSGTSSAAQSTLIAYGGSNNGYGGRIAFYDDASGGSARVHLFGNAKLDLANHNSGITLGMLELNGGIIELQLGRLTTALTLSGTLKLNASEATFFLLTEENGGFEFNTVYTLLTAANLSEFTSQQFVANSIEGIAPTFTISGNDLQVSYVKS